MRLAMLIGGAIVALMGGVFFFQGIGIVLGSPMTSQPFWAIAGGGMLGIGLALFVLGLRRGRANGK